MDSTNNYGSEVWIPRKQRILNNNLNMTTLPIIVFDLPSLNNYIQHLSTINGKVVTVFQWGLKCTC